MCLVVCVHGMCARLSTVNLLAPSASYFMCTFMGVCSQGPITTSFFVCLFFLQNYFIDCFV